MINKNVKLSLLYELDNLHHVVVQASDVGSKYVYALQLLHKQTDIIVYREQPSGKHVIFDEDNPIVYLTNMAGGHTQTWTYAGEKDRWFIGTKPKKHGSILWDTQIARIDLANAPVQVDANTALPRLSYLNRAGSGFGDGSVAYPGKDLERLEAAVSPDYKKFLIASIDLNHVGHFALYDLAEVNAALDQAEADNSDVNIQNLHCLGAFNIPNMNTDPLKSIQGYDIDEDNNIYISSQLGPTTDFLGLAKEGKPREIVKIPWGEADSSKWEVADLMHDHTVDALGFVTEFESVQVISPDEIYLTVAYHRKSDLKSLKNRVYKIEGFGD
ncbi:hypothetical protein EJK17_02755 [Lactobacillus xujianguonis]|uniref:Bacteriocin n=1 Tax=Lactobacillus xujianguonis TaxID=2495899 RepID=A0A437SX32_9LACO|nr:class III bacteriocin [Lactobacillus xujianguonis]RVU71377.1 hypothetical protein EJK17_02755 [Lactobacillus xujianguonis]RVU76962.1 hypothetical protein EJK20_03155 [Lactobacillus xujianguonis]